jgi:phenylalanyl-tRNA synthetase beta chain
MGGANSEVGDSTTELFIEVACFDARRVRRSARRLGLATDASHRFERGVDPEGQPFALRRVVELILAVAGGEVAGGVDLVPELYERCAVGLREERVERVLGVRIDAAEIRALLEPIGFEVDTRPRPMRVLVPGFRPDVGSEIDLIEEVARRRGYGTFEEQLLPFLPTGVPEHPSVAVERRMRALFVSWGLLETRAGAFGAEADAAVPLLNPLSSEEAFLRTSLIPGLLRRTERNFAHGVRDVRLFEVGATFHPAEGELPREEGRAAAVLSGARRPPHFSGPAPDWEPWDARGLLEELAGEYPDGRVEAGEGRFVLWSGDRQVGWARAVAAGELDAPAWAGAVMALEVVLPAAAPTRAAVRYRPIPTHPGSERDLALLLPAGVGYAGVDATLRAGAGELLEDTYPFDLYEGKGIPEGTRSLGVRLRFRAPDRTLTDAEVDGAVGRVLALLEERHGVRRR